MAGSRIAGITIEIGGDTTKLRSALQGVDKEIRGTQTALKDIDKLLKLDPGNTELLTQKQKNLKTAIEDTKDRLKALQEAAKSSDLGADEHDRIQREIIETEQKLKGLQTQYKEFGSVAKQQMQAAADKMQEVGGKVKQAGDSIASFGKGLTAGVTVPLVAIGTKGVASFAEVDKTMQLTNKTMGSTKEEADMLNQAMKDAAANSTYGMSDAATATLNFARAGLDAKEAADTLAPAMNLAAGEGGNLDTVSAGLVATINGFHGSFSEAATYADVFAAACNNSALDVDSLSNAMSVAAPVFSAAGYSVNDAALYMGVMANNGIDADKAANSLKTGLARLVSPTAEAATKLEELGICVTNSDGTMKDSVQVQKELHDAFANLSESEQIAAASAIFGKNQMSPWLALINTAPEDVNTLNDSLANCAGTTEEMANAMMSGFGGSLEKLKSSIDVLVTSVGEALAPVISKVADFIQRLVDKFNALTPEQQQQVVQIGLLVAAIGPLIVVVGKVVSGIGSIIQVGGMLMSCLSSLCSPVGLVVAAIAALVAIGVALYQNWDEICAWAQEIWSRIKETVSNLVTQMKDKLSETWQSIKDTVSNVWNSIKDFFKSVWDGIKNAVTSAVDSVKEKLSNTWSAIKETVSNVWNGIKDTISSVWNAIKGAVSNAINAVKDTISNVWSAIKDTASSVWNGIKDTLSNIWETIKDTVSGVWNTIKDTITNVWEGIKDGVRNAIENVKDTVENIFNSVRETVSNIWNNIKDGITNPIETAKNVVENIIDGIRNVVTNVFEGLRDAVANIWEGIKNAITAPIEAAKSVVENIVNGIKNILSSIGDAVSGAVGKVREFLNINAEPTVQIAPVPTTWHKDAMRSAMTLDHATIFGMAGGRLQGAGESGREVVSGESHLVGLINQSVDSALGSRLDSIASLLNQYLPEAAQTKVAVPVDGIDSALSARAARRVAAW